MKQVLNLYHYRLRDEGKVWFAYIHTVNQIMHCWDMAVWTFPRRPPAAILNLIQPEWRRWIRRPRKPTLEPNTKSIGWRVAEIWPFEVFQDGRRPPSCIWSNRKWRRWIRRPRKPHLAPNTKSIGWRVAEIWPFEVFQDGRRPPSWIWSNLKWRRWIRRPPKRHPRTKHEGDRLTRCRVMAIWNFPKMCELDLRSVVKKVVGRQYSYFLHWSHNSSFATLGT